MPYSENKNVVIVKLNNKISPKLIANKHVEILVSVGVGVNNGKKLKLSDVVLLEKVAREVSKYHPKSIIFNLADTLQRWNYYNMLQYISNKDDDIELKTLLQDIPDNVNEEQLAVIFAEKFSNIAKSLGEQEYNKLDKHFKEKHVYQDIKIPIKIKRWDNRDSTENYNHEIDVDTKVDQRKVEETKDRFLGNKQDLLQKSEKRIKNAQPKLAHVNFKNVNNISCERYIGEEVRYAIQLEDTEIWYGAKAPPALEPIVPWREFGFKIRSLEEVEKEAKQLKEIMNTEIDKSSEIKQETATKTTSTLSRQTSAGRLTLFRPRPVDIKNLQEDLSEEQNIIIQTSDLSPKSAERVKTVLKLFAEKKPTSPEVKEQIYKKLDEVSALLLAVRA
jgi:hypothetical protein